MKKSFFLLFTLLAPVWAWAVQGTLTPLKGTTYLQRQGKELWETVKSAMAVEEGDRIRTGSDSSASLILPDDHRVAIEADSDLSLPRMDRGETQLDLKKGSIRNKVRHLELGQYYKVQTPSAVAAVRGTDFSVFQMPRENMTHVRVYEGFVDVSALREDIAHTITHLTAGQMTSVDAAGHIEPAKSIPASGQTAVPSSSVKPAAQKNNDQSSDKHTQGPPPPGGSSGAAPVLSEGQAPPLQDSDTAMAPSSTDQPTDDNAIAMNDPSNSNGAADGTGGDQPVDANPGPLPTGTNGGPTAGLDPVSAGNQALYDTIQSQGLQDRLNGLLVASLFNDGSVRLSPIDGQFHLYADVVAQNGPNGVKFLNATMVYGQPDSLNYQTTAMTFNQPLPADYTLATRNAFRSDFTDGTSGPPAYYATDVDNYRSNTVDYVDVLASGGNPIYNSAYSRYVTDFPNGSTVVNGTTLWSKSNGVYSYLGDAAPTVYAYNGNGQAYSGVVNSYADGTYLGRQVTYIDSTDQIATLASVPAGMAPSDYLNSPDAVVHDTLYSNLFQKGPIVAFGSAQSRLLGGLDSVVNDSDAKDILNGSLPVGAPDGLFHQ